MKRLILGGLALLLCSGAMADTCVKTREEASQQTKLCFYQCTLLGTRVLTVGRFENCPLRADFDN